MMKIILASMASLLVSGGLLGAAQVEKKQEMAAESKAGEFGSFMAKNYPALDAYLKSIGRTYIYDEATNWPNERGTTLNAIFLHTLQVPTFIASYDPPSQVRLRRFEMIKEFEDLWNRFGKNSDLPENTNQIVQRLLQGFFSTSLYGTRILQQHNEMFYNIWKNANTIEDRSNALIYLANTIAAACRADSKVPECYDKMEQLIHFIKDNGKKFTKFAREIVEEQIKKVVNEELKSEDSLKGVRGLIKLLDL